MILKTVEGMIVQGLRNGMSLEQIKERVPSVAARQLNLTIDQFHRQFEAEADGDVTNLNIMVQQIVSQFTPEEQRAIANR